MNIKNEMIKELETLPGVERHELLKLDLDDLAKCYVALMSSKAEEKSK